MNSAEENEPKPLRIIGMPKRRNGKYVLDEFAILGRECGWICPRCNNEVRICPDKAGEQQFVCKTCNASFTVCVDAEADTFMIDKKKASAAAAAVIAGAAAGKAAGAAAGKAAGAVAANVGGPLVAPQQEHKPARGMLLMPEDADDQPVVKPQQPVAPVVKPQLPVTPPVDVVDDDSETQLVAPSKASGAQQNKTPGVLQWGGFFSRKRFTLPAGSTIIGRKDKKTPSDVEFDDPEMSRRSVKVDAIPCGNGECSFTLTVLKALNAVKLNDKKVEEGSTVRIKHNDVIVMGKTSLVFKCSK